MILTSKLKPFPNWFSIAIVMIGFVALLLVTVGGDWNGTVAGKVAFILVLLLLIAIYGRAAIDARTIAIDTAGYST